MHQSKSHKHVALACSSSTHCCHGATDAHRQTREVDISENADGEISVHGLNTIKGHACELRLPRGELDVAPVCEVEESTRDLNARETWARLVQALPQLPIVALQ